MGIRITVTIIKIILIIDLRFYYQFIRPGFFFFDAALTVLLLLQQYNFPTVGQI